MTIFVDSYSLRLVTVFSPETSAAIFGGAIKVKTTWSRKKDLVLKLFKEVSRSRRLSTWEKSDREKRAAPCPRRPFISFTRADHDGFEIRCDSFCRIMNYVVEESSVYDIDSMVQFDGRRGSVRYA